MEFTYFVSDDKIFTVYFNILEYFYSVNKGRNAFFWLVLVIKNVFETPAEHGLNILKQRK